MSEVQNDPSSGTQRSQANSMADFGATPTGRRDYLVAEIHAAEKEMGEWHKRANKVVKRYRDDRSGAGLGAFERKYAMLWSNVQTILPSIFSKAPEPVVMRRYLDPDNVARVAAMIMERCLDFQICSQDSFISAMRLALQDRLLPGMGTVWVRYQKAQDSPTGTVDNDYYSKLMGEAAPVDYVYWQDFGWVPARTWDEVPMIWRIVYMNRDQLKERFGKVGEEVTLDYVPARHQRSGEETDQPKNTVFKQARIYEVWDKRSAKVAWISTSYPTPLDEKNDPMRFPGFFPCPKPLFATNTTGNLVPVPDYVMYQDQANELDTITQRLYHLTKALKVVGVYDSEQQGVQRMLTEGVENQLIPVDTWAAFAEKGGIKGTVDFMPIDKVVEVVTQLYQIRSSLITDIYQLTGISDIMRGGAQDAGATATEQRIKAQFASVRLGDMKDQMARFVTDTLRLMAHVMLEFFEDETLVQQSCIMQTPDGQKAIKDAQAAMTARMAPPAATFPPPAPPQGANGAAGGPPMPHPMMPPPGPPPMQMGQQSMPPGNGGQMGSGARMGGSMMPPPPLGMGPQPMPPVPPPPPPGPQDVISAALKMLKDGRQADFRIEVSSDTMIEPDLEAERSERNQFVQNITGFLQQALPAAQAMPEIAPLIQGLLMFSVRGYRTGRDLEGIIESSITALATAPPKPPPPDPKMEAVKAKAQADQTKSAQDGQIAQSKLQGEMQKMQAEMQLKMQEMQATLQLEREKQAGELQAMREKTQAEVEAILIKANVTAETTRQAAEQKAALQVGAEQQAVQSRAATAQQDMAINQATHEQTLQQSKETHKQDLVQSEADAKHERSEAAKEKKAEGE